MVRGMKVIEDEGNAVREKQFKEKTKQEKNSFVSLKHVESPFSKTYEVCLHSCKKKKEKKKAIIIKDFLLHFCFFLLRW